MNEQISKLTNKQIKVGKYKKQTSKQTIKQTNKYTNKQINK